MVVSSGAGHRSGESIEVLETVQRHYSALFEDAEGLSATTGNLVFTGGEDDPDTVATLADMGFRQPAEISATIRGWHFGRYDATRSAQARERLTELMPQLLQALGGDDLPRLVSMVSGAWTPGLPAPMVYLYAVQSSGRS